MARGNLPSNTPQVPSDSFFAVNALYLWAKDVNVDLSAVEGRRKTTNGSVVSSTALALDANLTAPLARNRKYRLQGRLFFSTNFKFRFVGPSSPTLIQLTYERIDTAGDSRSFLAAYSGSDIVCVNAGVVAFDSIVHNGVTAGEFGISWAQNTSSVSPSLLYAGSWLQHSFID